MRIDVKAIRKVQIAKTRFYDFNLRSFWVRKNRRGDTPEHTTTHDVVTWSTNKCEFFKAFQNEHYLSSAVIETADTSFVYSTIRWATVNTTRSSSTIASISDFFFRKGEGENEMLGQWCPRSRREEKTTALLSS